MKTLATTISAATLVLAATAVSAWGWPPFADGYNNSWGISDTNDETGTVFNGFGYPSYGYGYTPYGYGVPVPPAAELTAEQKQALADRQAKAAEYFQALQQQAAQFYAENPHPVVEMQRTMFQDRNAHLREMAEFMRDLQENMTRDSQESMPYRPYDMERPVYQDRDEWRQEMEARIAESRKATDARRKAAQERFEALKQEHAARIEQLKKDRPGV